MDCFVEKHHFAAHFTKVESLPCSNGWLVANSTTNDPADGRGGGFPLLSDLSDPSPPKSTLKLGLPGHCRLFCSDCVYPSDQRWFHLHWGAILKTPTYISSPHSLSPSSLTIVLLLDWSFHLSWALSTFFTASLTGATRVDSLRCVFSMLSCITWLLHVQLVEAALASWRWDNEVGVNQHTVVRCSLSTGPTAARLLNLSCRRQNFWRSSIFQRQKQERDSFFLHDILNLVFLTVSYL